MSKVYVITTGSYSDYEVDSVFDDVDEMNKYLRVVGNVRLNDPIEFELNKFGTYFGDSKRNKFLYGGQGQDIYRNQVHSGKYWTHIWFISADDGRYKEIQKEAVESPEGIWLDRQAGWQGKKIDVFTAHFYARDMAHAEKIFQDKYAQARAIREGVA